MENLKQYLLSIFMYQCLILSMNNYSFSQEMPELKANRPGISESPGLVVPKAIQIETGFFTIGNTDGTIQTKLYNYNNTVIRVGINSIFELRFGMSYLTSRSEDKQDNSTSSFSGFSPFSLGTSINLTQQKEWLPETYLVGYLVLPSGTDNFRNKYTTPSFMAVFANKINNRLYITNNVGVSWSGDVPKATWAIISCLDIIIGKNVGAFIESYNYFPENNKTSFNCDAGLYYKLKQRVQVDFSVGRGISDNAPDYFFDVGITKRFLK